MLQVYISVRITSSSSGSLLIPYEGAMSQLSLTSLRERPFFVFDSAIGRRTITMQTSSLPMSSEHQAF